MGVEPKVMFIVDHSVKEGGDTARVISRRMQFVEIDAARWRNQRRLGAAP
jgi:hypothetical protein